MSVLKLLKTVLRKLERFSFAMYLGGFVYLIFLNTDAVMEDVWVSSSSLRTHLDLSEDIPMPFSHFEYKIKKSTTAQFIHKTFLSLKLETFVTTSPSGQIIHAIHRARKSDRKEGIIIITKYDVNKRSCFEYEKSRIKGKVVSGTATILSLAKYLQKKNNLAKDVVFVAVPKSNSAATEKKLIAFWANKYFSSPNDTAFPRAGRIAVALTLDFSCQFNPHELILLSVDKLGSLPNMDVISSSTNYFIRNKIPFSIFNSKRLGPSTTFLIKSISESKIGVFLYSLFPWQLKDAISCLGDMLSFIFFQALSSDNLVESDSVFMQNGINSLSVKSVAPFNADLSAFSQRVYASDMIKYLYYFVITFGSLHEALQNSLSIYILLNPFKVIQFFSFSLGFLFFLSPIILFSINVYLSEKEHLERKGVEFALCATLFFSGAFVWICPVIFRAIFANNSAIRILSFSSATLGTIACAYLTDSRLKSRRIDFVLVLVISLFSLFLLPLSLINTSLSFVNCVTISPLLFLMCYPSVTTWLFVIVLETLYLSIAIGTIGSVFGGLGEFLNDCLNGFTSLERFRNLNYFSFFLLFYPVAILCLVFFKKRFRKLKVL